jgi:hypothetical protein
MSTLNYATVEDIKALRPLTAQEEQQAGVLIQYASDKLRVTAAGYGKDLDSMVEDDESYANNVRYAVVQAVMNALGRLAETTNGANGASQATQSALGYSVTLTYMNAGSFLWFGRNDLKGLGIAKQTYGAMDIYGTG